MIPITFWEVIRGILLFVCFTLLPGVIAVYFIHSHLRTVETLALSFGWSLLLNVVIAYAVHFVGSSLEAYIFVILVWDVVGSGVILWKSFGHGYRLKEEAFETWLYCGLVLGIGAIWFVVILQNGPRIDYDWDHWFHIAHAREVIESHQIIPPNPYWPDEDLFEAFGMWHTLLGAVGRSASLSMTVLWRIGNAYMAALGFIIIYSIAGSFFIKRFDRLLAALVFLASGVGAMQITRTFLYPWGSATLLLWISLALLFKYLKYPSRRSILSAVAIGLVPLFIHPQEYIFLCFSAFALGMSGLLLNLFRRCIPVSSSRIWRFFLALMLIGVPFLLLKYPGTVASLSNTSSDAGSDNMKMPLYEDRIAKFLAMAFPYYYKSGLLLHSLIPFTLLTLLFSILLVRRVDSKTGWFLLIMTWGPTLAALLPGLSWITHLVLKETYAWRLLNLVPTPIVWSAVISMGTIDLFRADRFVRADENGWRRGNWIYTVLSVTLLVGVALGVTVVVKYDELTPSNSTEKPLRFRAVYEKLDRLDSNTAVILSDPMTSYTIPALTRHRVVLNEMSHGTRDDLLVRFADARRLLSDPTQSPDRAIATLEHYGVDFIIVNKFWIDRVFFPQTLFYSDYTLGFLSNNDDCFRLTYTDEAFEVFEYRRCEPTALRRKGLQPRDAVSIESVEYRIEYEVTNDLGLLGISLGDDESILSGHELPVDLYWRADEDIYESFAVWVELLCDYPGRSLPYSKFLRRRYEAKKGEVFGVEDFGWLPLPASDVDRQALLLQRFSLRVPPDLSGESCDLNAYVMSRRQALFDQEMLPVLLLEKEQMLSPIPLKQIERSIGD